MLPRSSRCTSLVWQYERGGTAVLMLAIQSQFIAGRHSPHTLVTGTSPSAQILPRQPLVTARHAVGEVLPTLMLRKHEQAESANAALDAHFEVCRTYRCLWCGDNGSYGNVVTSQVFWVVTAWRLSCS